MDRVIKQAEDLAKDNIHGASWIFRRLVELICECKELDCIERVISIVSTTQSGLAPVLNLGVLLKQVNFEGACLSAKAFMRKAEASRLNAVDEFVKLTKGLHSCITISDSSAVRDALAMAGHIDTVVVGESRPMFEGRGMAEYLSKIGKSVVFVVDAVLISFVDQVDMVVLGADAVTDDAFVNKVGSKCLSLAARLSNKPVFVLADTSKILNKNALSMYKPKHGPFEELWREPPFKVIVENPYLEWVKIDKNVKILM